MRLAGDDDFGGDAGKFLQQLAHERDYWIICLRHAEEHAHRAAIVLSKPAAQALDGVFIRAFKRFEQHDGRRERIIHRAPVQWEAARSHELPEQQPKTEQRKKTEDDGDEHGEVLGAEVQSPKGKVRRGHSFTKRCTVPVGLISIRATLRSCLNRCFPA